MEIWIRPSGVASGQLTDHNREIGECGLRIDVASECRIMESHRYIALHLTNG